MRYAILAVGLALIGGLACQQKEAETAAAENTAAVNPAEGFEFTVEKKGLELSFSGVRGVQWNKLTQACKEIPCEFILDSAGLNTGRPVSGFGIGFRLDAKGVFMSSSGGASWDTLNYACADAQCSFKVDEKGVAGL
jgi:hypothetical protein